MFMAHIVLGIFTARDQAEEVVRRLEKAGYRPKDVSIVVKEGVVSGETVDHPDTTGDRMAGGAASGMATGAAIGGLTGLLVGIGAIAIPGVGGLLIGGPLAAALGLTGAAATTVSGAATGALAGGLVGALVGIGIPEEDARYYEKEVQSGAILLAVPARTGEAEDAEDILDAGGAQQVRTIRTPGL